ncbi:MULTISPECIES: TraX family protein [unclassified Leptolyngbya]|uniref:TraX family protein n=1 Tax=unclassified Leptolyngbya TaxID=2650499 RepID=UPI0016874972|nr:MULTISPECIES: TraX family protein [unclassified Leptolyngbya]MBD1912417.1 TraX family protein [Leptolyngbya sp. FACHB-8]MBD2157918.1 TraX family protein [Leptolyngbya sp. FACHB-16]
MVPPLTNYHIKLLAAALMVVDHVGVIFFPELPILRVIGRFSFPLFAWLLVQGEQYTHHMPRYLLRLIAWGFISHPVYLWAFEISEPDLNILFSLALGALCLRGRRQYPQWELPIWVGGGVLAELSHASYGFYGIGAIALIRTYKLTALWWLFWILLHLFTELQWGYNQLPAVLSPLIFHLTNGERGAKARWFYLFYPAHLLILGLIHLQIQQPTG